MYFFEDLIELDSLWGLCPHPFWRVCDAGAFEFRQPAEICASQSIHRLEKIAEVHSPEN